MNNQPSTQPNNELQSPKKRRRSPNAGSFRKGQSGNRRGRPPGSGKQAEDPYRVLLNKTVTTTIRGKISEMPIEEAIQHRTFKDALAGKPRAIRQVLEWIKEREAWLKQHRPTALSQQTPMRESSPDPDNADQALMFLGIARIDRYRAKWGLERTPLIIEPWAVELALSRNRNGADFSQRDWDHVKLCTRDFEVLMSAASHSRRDTGDIDEQP
ncbi:DUF5681 domain-containing protein [Bradyrhizobium sp. LTSP857]|uniref:DUF5681 domain-containing protein n=1 Tax=Bradyrhizobium sp. LTSP857 TaxID=1619231 RepID=UPI0005D258FD|nr:DUF5681 domain-containing protein [Bradyrhizobium sp. LTSP857]KJC36500.1 hypothetical protein UP06_32860 [Bradyrhizobium sp. LTSP857]